MLRFHWRIKGIGLVLMAAAVGSAAQAPPFNPGVAAAAQGLQGTITEYRPPPGQCWPLPAGLAGQSLKDALLSIDATKHFRRRAIAEGSSLPRDTVTRVSAPTLIEGNFCAVDVYYSDGSLTKVPPLKGSNRDQALQALTGASLQLALAEEPSEESAGLVFKQVPDPGTEVPRGSGVTATFAIAMLYDVPGVIGMQYEVAAPQLQHFAVVRNDVASTRALGEVTDQEPHAPAQLSAGAAVRLDVSDGSQVVVPPVKEKKQQEAQDDLGKAGLTATIDYEQGSATPGIVATQDPDAGTVVARGSAVRLVVGQAADDAGGGAGGGGGGDGGGGGGGGDGGGGGGGRNWIWYVSGLAALVLLGGATFLLWPVPKPTVSARVETDIEGMKLTDVDLAGPEIQLAARIEVGPAIEFRGKPP